jgi:hypothetical protein
MKKLIPAMLLLALGLSSCAVKTVTRKELLTPTLATAMDSSELTDMKYYGSDAEYDYFTRGYTRYRVLKSENCLPESARFAFNNWQGGKLYRDCLKESVGSSLVSKLQNLLNGASATNTVAQPVTTQTTTPQTYQPKTQTGQAIKSILEQYKPSKSAQ